MSLIVSEDIDNLPTTSSGVNGPLPNAASSTSGNQSANNNSSQFSGGVASKQSCGSGSSTGAGGTIGVLANAAQDQQSSNQMELSRALASNLEHLNRVMNQINNLTHQVHELKEQV